MTKYSFEFYDFYELISHFEENRNHNIDNVFDSLHTGNAFEMWCEYHGIDPHRTKTTYKPEVQAQWQGAVDRENFYPPFVAYGFEICKLVKNTNRFGIGVIDLNTFKDDINDAIGISSWSIYWKKYEGVIYSLNESFVSLFLPYSVDGILTVFDSGYFDNE